MRIPHNLLRSTAVIQDFQGSGPRGPLFGEPRTVRCSKQPTSRVIASGTGIGQSVLAIDVLMTIRPEDGPVRPQSTVTIDGEVYQVRTAEPYPDERRPSQWELALTRNPGTARAMGSGS